jgi:hypothetical protein
VGLAKGPAMEGVIERTVAYFNIQHYKKLLETEIDETKRRMVTRLLAEEEAKLRSLAQPAERERQFKT